MPTGEGWVSAGGYRPAVPVQRMVVPVVAVVVAVAAAAKKPRTVGRPSYRRHAPLSFSVWYRGDVSLVATGMSPGKDVDSRFSPLNLERRKCVCVLLFMAGHLVPPAMNYHPGYEDVPPPYAVPEDFWRAYHHHHLHCFYSSTPIISCLLFEGIFLSLVPCGGGSANHTAVLPDVVVVPDKTLYLTAELFRALPLQIDGIKSTAEVCVCVCVPESERLAGFDGVLHMDHISSVDFAAPHMGRVRTEEPAISAVSFLEMPVPRPPPSLEEKGGVVSHAKRSATKLGRTAQRATRSMCGIRR
ncbi:hypothetical protein HPB50_018564 [Hyalomma asiaticum]|uniref:Uncharacterized protein n=1 Tax=Hyalomma asiaticum TaxID=266040 RepID=A0ACB7SZY6_HYAAI|nr:hypothetical protein HPB50_018564 [Hyalomma asiaticum]